MSKRTVFITGAGGFIGEHLVRRFLDAGYQVIASDRPGVSLQRCSEAGASARAADILDSAQLREAMAGADIVVHAAALFDLSAPAALMDRVNVGGTRNICEACLEHGVARLVLISSVATYGVPSTTPCPEHAAQRAEAPYELSKLRAERLAFGYHRERGLSVTSLRPALVYGPGSRYGHSMFLVSLSMIRIWGWQRFVVVDASSRSNHVHVQDVVEAALTLGEHPQAAGRAFNVCDERPTAVGDMSRMLIEQCGLQPIALPRALAAPAVALLDRVEAPLDTQLARLNKAMARSWPGQVERLGLTPALQPRFERYWLTHVAHDHTYSTDALRSLGWKARHPYFMESFPEVIRWYRQQGWLPDVAKLGQAARERVARKSGNQPVTQPS